MLSLVPCFSRDPCDRPATRFGEGDTCKPSSSSPSALSSPSRKLAVRRGIGVPLRLGVPGRRFPLCRGVSSPVLMGTVVVVGSPRNDWFGDPGESESENPPPTISRASSSWAVPSCARRAAAETRGDLRGAGISRVAERAGVPLWDALRDALREAGVGERWI